MLAERVSKSETEIEKDDGRERAERTYDGNCELGQRPDSSTEIMHVQMDLFNVFKRYAHFGEQSTDKMAKVSNVFIHTKERLNTLYSHKSMHMFGRRLNSLQTMENRSRAI